MSVNWSDELKVLSRVGPSRDLWPDVLARADSRRRAPLATGRSVAMFAWTRSSRRRTVVAVSVAALTLVGAASAFAYHFLGPSPGFTAGLSSLNNLPTAPWPASLPRGALNSEASAAGLTPDEAAQRLRLVQSGLSLGSEAVGTINLYAFAGNSGTGCLFITGPDAGAICLPTWMTSNPALDGYAAAIAGGRSMHTPGPVAVYGLVADNISAVEVAINGATHNVPIVNNSFYADYDGIVSTDRIELTLQFEDGTTRTTHLPNPYAE